MTVRVVNSVVVIRKTLERAVERGGRIVTPVSKFYGDYDIARFTDRWNNLWWLYTLTNQNSEVKEAETNTDWPFAGISHTYGDNARFERAESLAILLIVSKTFCYYKIMERPNVRVGIGVFIFKNGKFLIQKRQGSHGEGTWSLPGGHLEFGESFEDTARREVKEESGLNIKNVRFGAVTNDHFIEENKHYVTIWMLSDWQSGNVKNMEPEKCTAQIWSTLDDLPEPLFLTWCQLFKSEFFADIMFQLEAS